MFLGFCLEVRVFGNWEGEEGISKVLGGGRGFSGRFYYREFSRGVICGEEFSG